MSELLDRADGGVIALGGGSLVSERVRAALRRHRAVLLDVDVDTAWQRAGGRGRPLARDRVRFEELHAARAVLYAEAADVVIPAGERAALQHALPYLDSLDEAPAGTRLLWATSASGDYPVYVGRGLVGSGFWPPAASGAAPRRFCVTDETVARPLRAGARGACRPCSPSRPARIRRRWRARRRCCGRWPRRDSPAPTRWSRWAAASSATSPASARRPTSAASRSCRFRPPSSRRSTRPTAARRASTSPRRRTTSAPTTSRPRCSPTRPCSPRCRDAERAAGYAEVVKTALIAGGAALGARARAAPPATRTT